MSLVTTHSRIDAVEYERDGAVRLLRRRGPFGLLRRDVYHPGRDASVPTLIVRSVTLDRDGNAVVEFEDWPA